MIRAGDELRNNRIRKMSEDANSVQRMCWNGAVEIRKESCHSFWLFFPKRKSDTYGENTFTVSLYSWNSMRPYRVCKALVLPCLNSSWLAWSWVFFWQNFFWQEDDGSGTYSKWQVTPFTQYLLKVLALRRGRWVGGWK